MKNKIQQQQGDLVFESARIPAQARRVTSGPHVEANRVVFAHGEATGHAHAVATKTGIEIYEHRGVMYARVKERCLVQHEEHGPVILDPGEYQFSQVFEYDHFENEARTVID